MSGPTTASADDAPGRQQAASARPAIAPGADPPGADWDTAPLTPASPMLHLDGFDGPMGTLLALAERQRIDLGRLSIQNLAEQFVAEMGGRLRNLPLERRADWLVVAAHLLQLYIRSRQAPPEENLDPAGRPAAAQPGPRAAAHMPAAADWLEARLDWMGQGLTRPPAGPDPRVASYMELMEACLFVLCASGRAAVPEPVYQPSRRGLWTVEDAMGQVRGSLAGRPEGGRLEGFVPALPAGPDRDLQVCAAVASTLLAGLELAREGTVALHQAAPFGEVVLAGAARSERPQERNQGQAGVAGRQKVSALISTTLDWNSQFLWVPCLRRLTSLADLGQER